MTSSGVAAELVPSSPVRRSPRFTPEAHRTSTGELSLGQQWNKRAESQLAPLKLMQFKIGETHMATTSGIGRLPGGWHFRRRAGE